MDPVRALLGQADAFLDRDHRLLIDPAGWRPAGRGPGHVLFRRREPDDPNDLFLWRIDRLEAPPARVQAAFVDRILDYHRHWTKEFQGGRVVAEPRPDAAVVYQTFDPGVPGVAKRDLCHLTVTRRLPSGAFLASHRPCDAVAKERGYERIRWWGASLCTAGPAPGTTTLGYLDRENQGGAFPHVLMNLLMPRYLREQCDRVIRFFADGGPPELRHIG
jgi:hypothetical protein